MLQDEAVLADFDIAPDEGLGAHIARQTVAHGLATLDVAAAQPVQLAVADGHEGVIEVRRIGRGEFVKRNNRPVVERRRLDVVGADGKGRNIPVAVVSEVLARHFGDLAIAHDHQGLERRPH